MVLHHNSDIVVRQDELYVNYAPFFGQMGVIAAMVFSAIGASYGTARAGSAIMSSFQNKSMVVKGLIPVVMASVNAIYGLVICIILIGHLARAKSHNGYSIHDGYAHFAAGMTCGLCGLGAGYAVGESGYHCVLAMDKEPKVFIGMVMIQAFASVLGLYGLIVALTMIAG